MKTRAAPAYEVALYSFIAGRGPALHLRAMRATSLPPQAALH
jgi:hypothetical protein